MEFNLTKFLKKVDIIIPHETSVRNAVIQAIQESIGITLERSKIGVKGPVIQITGTSALRSEIVIKKAKILSRIAELAPDSRILKIN